MKKLYVFVLVSLFGCSSVNTITKEATLQNKVNNTIASPTLSPQISNSPLPTPTPTKIPLPELEGKILLTKEVENKNQLFIMKDGQINQIKLDNNNSYSQARWSHNGSKIIFILEDTNKNRKLCLINQDGTNQKILLNNLPENFYYYWSSNSRDITFEKDDDIYIQNTSNLELTNLTKTEKLHDYQPNWSYDGQKIVFVHGRDIAIMDKDGTGMRQLTDNVNASYFWYYDFITDGPYGYPVLSPDGSRIYFTAGDYIEESIRVINSSGTILPIPDEKRRLLPESGGSTKGDFEPTLRNLDGTEAERFTEIRPFTHFPIIMSRDGNKIAYVAGGGGGFDIAVLNVKNKNSFMLGKSNYENLCWSPDSSKLLFSYETGGLLSINSDGTDKTKILDENYVPSDWNNYPEL